LAVLVAELGSTSLENTTVTLKGFPFGFAEFRVGGVVSAITFNVAVELVEPRGLVILTVNFLPLSESFTFRVSDDSISLGMSVVPWDH
jgi:hypothetical protein